MSCNCIYCGKVLKSYSPKLFVKGVGVLLDRSFDGFFCDTACFGSFLLVNWYHIKNFTRVRKLMFDAVSQDDVLREQVFHCFDKYLESED